MWIASRRVHLMGTFIELQVAAPRPEELLDGAVVHLKDCEHRFSANDPHSELAELNAAAGRHAVRVHPDLFKLITLGVEHSLAEGSMLNIAIGSLVQLWRISFADARVPTSAEIERALEVTDPRAIELDASTNAVYLRTSGMSIDLGALAKGFFADQIISRWKQDGASCGFINLGGNVLTFGQSPYQPDGRWRVGLRHPLHPDTQVIGALRLKDRSVVTSGVYERVLRAGGRSFHHLLDPRTGYPIETDIISLSIISPQSIEGEIWTTRLFGHSIADILRAVGELPRVEAVLISDDRRLYATLRCGARWNWCSRPTGQRTNGPARWLGSCGAVTAGCTGQGGTWSTVGLIGKVTRIAGVRSGIRVPCIVVGG